MAKSAEDLANLVDILVDDKKFSQNLATSWEGMKIGFGDDKLWSFIDFICTADPDLISRQSADYKAVKAKLREAGPKIHQGVPFESMDELNYDGEDALEHYHDFVTEPARYIGFFDPPIKNIGDLVVFSKQNADKKLPREYPGQQLLNIALKFEISEAKCKEAFNPINGHIPDIAAAAQYPVGILPLGYSPTDGRPYGLAFFAAGAGGEEAKILDFMTAWEATMPKRKPPPQMVDWDEKIVSKV